MMSLCRPPLQIDYYTVLLTQIGSGVVLRRNIQNGAFIGTNGSYSDTLAEVLTPHRRNTRRQ